MEKKILIFRKLSMEQRTHFKSLAPEYLIIHKIFRYNFSFLIQVSIIKKSREKI